MKSFFLKNVSRTALSFNLPKKSNGAPSSLHLAQGEVSRVLTEAEVKCSEIQRAMSKRFLVDVSSQMKK